MEELKEFLKIAINMITASQNQPTDSNTTIDIDYEDVSTSYSEGIIDVTYNRVLQFLIEVKGLDREEAIAKIETTSSTEEERIEFFAWFEKTFGKIH